ncbi:MAG: hypothetical protein HOV68_33845, partial [Streptomycetaceae bacterium]|nr:hypothetical protein [Streptomycetaceae bacterium]
MSSADRPGGQDGPDSPAAHEDQVFSGEDWYARELSGLSFTRCSFLDTDW